MRTITTTDGATLALDGDLLALIEGLYRSVTGRHGLDRTFEHMVQEIHHAIDQMTDEERRSYFAESLFLNTVTYENERLGAYMRRLVQEHE